MWRDDGRCGPGHHLNNTNIIAQCNPDLGNECCSSDGWCGSSTKHCCQECVKYARSFGDFDLPVCKFKENTNTECPEGEDVCIRVKIATNTTVRQVDRHVTIRKCGVRDADWCSKYVAAGHTCVDARQCGKDFCNGGEGRRWSWALVLVPVFIVLAR